MLGLSLLCYSVLASAVFVAGTPVHKLVDLTYTFDEDTPNWSGHKKFKLSPSINYTFETHGFWASANNLCAAEHAGTHMDAPLHFSRYGRTIDVIPYNKLYRVHGIKVDVTLKGESNPDYEISANDMEDWVKEHGDIPDGVVVLFETGYWKKAGDSKAYQGLDEDGVMHFPGLGAEVTQWLLDYGNRTGQTHGVLGVGVDTVSFDLGISDDFKSHRILLRPNSDRYGLENLNNLQKLPARGFTLTMLPMKIGGGTGGATRVLAEIGGEPMGGSGVDPLNCSVSSLLIMILSLHVVSSYCF